MVHEALEVPSPRFEELYSLNGRPSVPPEKLIQALLLQAFFSIRSERQLMQQFEYNLLFRWFVGLSMGAPVWDATTFTKNRERLLDADMTRQLLAAVLAQPRVAALMSDEHSLVDGTLWTTPKAATPSGISAARSVPTPPTPAPPTQMDGLPQSRTTPPPSWLTARIC